MQARLLSAWRTKERTETGEEGPCSLDRSVSSGSWLPTAAEKRGPGWGLPLLGVQVLCGEHFLGSAGPWHVALERTDFIVVRRGGGIGSRCDTAPMLPRWVWGGRTSEGRELGLVHSAVYPLTLPRPLPLVTQAPLPGRGKRAKGRVDVASETGVMAAASVRAGDSQSHVGTRTLPSTPSDPARAPTPRPCGPTRGDLSGECSGPACLLALGVPEGRGMGAV